MSEFDYNTDMRLSRKAGIEEGIEQGIEQGREQGREQGIQETKIETAKNLLKEGLATDVIARCIGLSLAEVEALK